jgi:hypothetical protein
MVDSGWLLMTVEDFVKDCRSACTRESIYESAGEVVSESPETKTKAIRRLATSTTSDVTVMICLNIHGYQEMAAGLIQLIVLIFI